VGLADALSSRVPGLGTAVDQAFMDGLGLGCTVVGVLCLVGALAGLFALPANRYDPLAESELVEAYCSEPPASRPAQ
jgi:hypothetical protein